ncbi:MAG TPA: hypothetical protein VG916_08095 [Gemmatimonadaceae bacterium]|nr:hypothetical protein [Gemmatimonadaceae bacterium]
MWTSARYAIAVVATVALTRAGVGAQEAGGLMPAGVMTHKVAGKTVLVDGNKMTLYTYAHDTMPGKSSCNGRCAQNWPPLKAAADAKATGAWTVVPRDDGSKMWAYKGKPLYTFVRDKAAGDMTGDGAGQGAWKMAVP